MSTIRRRLDDLQAARARQEQRKGTKTVVEDVRAMLEKADGQVDLDMRPGESIHDVLIRRLQVVDGYDLSLMPGETLKEKEHAVDLVCGGKLWVPDEARHAARFVFEMYQFLY